MNQVTSLAPAADQRLGIDQVHAHRGASGDAPENTLAAFRKAAELGARWVEFDVSRLGDDTLVVMHDATTRRCSDTDASLPSLTAADLERIDAGSWFGPEFRGECIPTLAQTLATLRETGQGANLEIKHHEHETDIAAVSRLIHAKVRGGGVELIISSFSLPALRAIRTLDPSYDVAILWHAIPADWREQVAEVQPSAIHLNYEVLSLQFLDQVHELGLKLRVYTCDRPAELGSFWERGLDAVITNFPARYL